MDGQFEQIEGNPFASAHDGEVFVPLAGHRDALSELTHWASEMDGVGLLTAGPGLGKTHLCRQLLKAAGDETRGVLVSHGHFRSVRELLQSILYLCERPFAGKDEHELSLELLGFIRELGRAGRRFLLIVDDAHELTEELLLELRALTAPQGEGTPPIRLLLSGQLEIEELLARRGLSALNQSLTTHQILEPLTREESADYLAGCLNAMNRDIETVLSEAALELIVQVSDGVPRCLNQMAEAAFREGLDRQLDRVTPECVRAAFEKVRHLPQHWNDLPEIPSDSRVLTDDELNDFPLSSDSDIFEMALDDTGHDALEDDPTEADETAQPHDSSQQPIESEETPIAAETEYVVAEFGSGLEEEVTDENSLPRDQTQPHFSSPKLAYSEEGRNIANVRKATLVGGAKGENHLGSSHSMLELDCIVPQDEGLEVRSSGIPNSSPHRRSASDHGKYGMSHQNSTSEVETRKSSSRYLRIDTNPIDIFAPDIPEAGNSNGLAEPSKANISTPAEVNGGSISEHVERLRKEAIGQWAPTDSKQLGQYDVIEPESIPAVPKARPSLELDFPNRQSKPRYRNLFRNLRRNRGG